MSNNSQVIVIRDLEIYWANLYKVHSPFGANVWDVQVRTTDDSKAQELTDAGVNLKKHDDGYYYGNVKRKELTAKGEPNKAPQVFKMIDGKKAPLAEPIGNGSMGHIKVFSYEYKVQGREGIACQVSAVLVTDLVEYNGGGDDFGIDDAPSGEDF